MAMRFAPQAMEPIRKGGPAKDRAYLSFIHQLPCVITHQCAVEAAHISYAKPEWGALGRGKSQKASDRFALPLSPNLHMQQHARGDERAWWADQGIDPHMICLVIYGLYNEMGPDDAIPFADRCIRQNIGRILP